MWVVSLLLSACGAGATVGPASPTPTLPPTATASGIAGVPAGGYYVRPAVVEIDAAAAVVREETFAPILYVSRYRDFAEAIHLQNDVPHGLASAVLTNGIAQRSSATLKRAP